VRYHQLFADLLRARLEQPDRAAVTPQRGSRYADHRLADDAIGHAVSAGDDQPPGSSRHLMSASTFTSIHGARVAGRVAAGTGTARRLLLAQARSPARRRLAEAEGSRFGRTGFG
jgi:hypothetical protein